MTAIWEKVKAAYSWSVTQIADHPDVTFWVILCLIVAGIIW